MNSVVVTGTGLFTAAGLGHDLLLRGLGADTAFAQPLEGASFGSEVSRDLVLWPASPEWQGARDYAGLGSQLAVTACQLALASSLRAAKPFEPTRGATVAVTGDDWTDQHLFDRALAKATSTQAEAQSLFAELDDAFLLRSFRWGVAFGIGAATGFQGPSVGIDCPSFGGLSGLRHAMDLIESGESDQVMLVGVDTVPRLDVAVSLQRLAREAKLAEPRFGQAAAALLLERSSSARERGASPLSRVVRSELRLSEVLEPALEQLTRDFGAAPKFSSSPLLGTLLNAGALVDVCLASQWLAAERASGRAARAGVVAVERFWASGVAATLLASEDAAVKGS